MFSDVKRLSDMKRALVIAAVVTLPLTASAQTPPRISDGVTIP